MSTEAVDRNNALQFIHNVKLPSYAVWDPDSIMDTTQTINLDWWININKIYIKKNTKNDRKNHFSGRLDMQSAHACAVQTHFFVFTFQWPKASKKEPKSAQNGAFGHPKS